MPSYFLGYSHRSAGCSNLLSSACLLLYRPSKPSAGEAYCWECYNPITSCRELSYPLLTGPTLDGINKVQRFELPYYTNCHYNPTVSAHTRVFMRPNHSYFSRTHYKIVYLCLKLYKVACGCVYNCKRCVGNTRMRDMRRGEQSVSREKAWFRG